MMEKGIECVPAPVRVVATESARTKKDHIAWTGYRVGKYCTEYGYVYSKSPIKIPSKMARKSTAPHRCTAEPFLLLQKIEPETASCSPQLDRHGLSCSVLSSCTPRAPSR